MRALTLALTLTGLFSGTAQANVYQWTYTGVVTSRQITNDPSGTLGSTLGSLFPNGTRFEVSFLLDTDKASFSPNSASNGNWFSINAGDNFITSGSLWIGTDSSTLYQASFNSAATPNGGDYNYHYSFNVRNDQNNGGPGNPSYSDGIVAQFNDDAINAAAIDGTFFLSSIFLQINTADSPMPSDVLGDLSIPTAIDSTLFDYNQAGIIFSFEDAAGTHLGHVRGGLGGEPGAYWNPEFPSWGTIPSNSLVIDEVFIPEPSTYAMAVACSALVLTLAYRRRSHSR